MSELKSFIQWSGCATYNQTVYRVVVIAPKDAFQSDIYRAISTAGGFNPRMEKDPPDKKPIQAASDGTKFLVEFIPDKRYTKDFPSRKPVLVVLSASNKKLHDGEFQKPVAPSPKMQNLIYCPKCAAPGYRGTVCKQCSTTLYMRR